MPKFKNVSKNNIDLIYNGRKIRIPPNGFIDGPPHLKIYKGLEIYIDSNTNSQNKSTPKIDISEDINNDNIIEIDKTLKHIKDYKKLPSVAICILTKNKLHLIKDCINSILDKVKYPNTKIYIFDTGTNELEVLQYYHTLSNTRIPITIHNMGKFHFSTNYNEGIDKFVNSDYVLIQNNDTVALNDYVSKLMKVAIVEKVGACGPRMLYKDGTIQHDGQFMFNHAVGSGFINPGHVNMGKRPQDIGGGRKIVDGITAAGILVRTKIYKQLGGFNVNFKDIYQDVHFNMLLRGSGYLSICDWDSLIHHYDNTSRKELWNIHEESAKMWKDSNYLFHELIPHDKILNNFKRNAPILSIVTLVNNKEQYINFLEDLKKQTFSKKFEIIALPNFNNEYKSAAEALNVGKDLAEGDYVVYCHQDLRVPSNWLQKITKHINKLPMEDVGFLGMAGVLYTEDTTPKKQDAAIYLSNTNSKMEKFADTYRSLLGDTFEVQCLDELCIIGKRLDHYRFDEINFDHYHWYGADICLQAILNGKKNYAIDAECIHISDGINNFFKDTHKEKYLEGSKKLFTKWASKLQKFRTTTATFNKSTNIIKFLFYHHLPDTLKPLFTEELKIPE
jgi:GT2 family glycosyltransferase